MRCFLLFTLCALTAEANVIRQAMDVFLDGTGRNNPDIGLSTLLMIRRAGYPAEAHAVQTEDGYLLTLHRIPNKGPTVHLQHGLLASSDGWVTLGKEKALPYLLWNAGYDVWLGNFRGNTYSKGHVSLPVHTKKYWNFSWHKHGIYDLPAMITYITEKTNQTLFSYIGHSMGTTSFYVMCSERPEMMEKVHKMYSLAPVAYLGHIRSILLRLILPLTPDVGLISYILGHGEFLPQDSFIRFITKYGCTITTLEERLCGNIMFTLAGFDNAQMNNSLIPVIVSHNPAGSSTKTVVHYSQLVLSHRFCQFDYGAMTNIKIYGSSRPPSYNLSKITMPIGLFYADNDYLADPRDVALLKLQLPNVFEYYRVPFKKFNHLDFIWAKDADKLLYRKVIEVMNKDRDSQDNNDTALNITEPPENNEI